MQKTVELKKSSFPVLEEWSFPQEALLYQHPIQKKSIGGEELFVDKSESIRSFLWRKKAENCWLDISRFSSWKCEVFHRKLHSTNTLLKKKVFEEWSFLLKSQLRSFLWKRSESIRSLLWKKMRKQLVAGCGLELKQLLLLLRLSHKLKSTYFRAVTK